jgi:phage shock protein PspC (stress-responsive transcriptional regulator)
MNKTIIINISGTIFHVEEEAYEKLKVYMTDVKNYFSKSEDSFEIISDIENRIAELFLEIIRAEEKEVIITKDVEKVIRTMGQPEQFEKEMSDEDIFTEEPTLIIKKRLYRNSEDKIAGGVCSGIAAYFNIDPIWVRLLLIISIFIFGTGVLLYIVLWMIMPEANTRTEKLAMRGESPTLESIRRSVEQEINGIRKNFDEQNKNRSSALRVLINNLVTAVRSILKFGIKVLVKAIGALIFALALALIIALSILISTLLGITNFELSSDMPLFLLREENQELMLITTYIVGMIPLLVIFLVGIRILFNTNLFSRISGLSLLGVWLLSLFVTIYYAVDTLQNFKEEGTLQETKILTNSSVDKFYLISDDDDSMLIDTIKTNELKIKNRVIIKSKNRNSGFDNIDIRVEKSDDENFKLVTNYISRGKTEKQAIELAENIKYDFRQIDSILIFPKIFKVKENSLWRVQEIDMVLYVPEGKELIIHQDVDQHIDNIYSHECKKDKQSRVYWRMGKDGLECEKDSILSTMY